MVPLICEYGYFTNDSTFKDSGSRGGENQGPSSGRRWSHIYPKSFIT